MDSYVGNNQFNPQQQQAENQNPGLLRFRSAPSSLFANFRDGFEKEVSFRYTHDSSENLVSGFGCGGGGIGGDGISAVKMEGSERIGQVMGQSHQLPPQYPKQQGLVRSSSGAMDQSIGRGLNLSRQSSSPAGFFDHVNGSNGYSMMKGTTNYRLGSSPNASESSPRASRFKAQIDFKSVLSPPMSHLPQIPEVGTEIVHESSSNDMKFMNHESEARFLDSPGFSFPPWNDPGSDGSQIPIPQNGGLGGRSNVLSHQLSMPNTSAEMAAIEKLLHFQDTVPFKVRAKRGCATHPRSIAERERRNRISERMRKLQDLVPNMDKQTNTADMLDLAVEYIKDLQRQHKNLSESRARCRCPKLS